jgi:hypothetical protein
MAQAEMPMRARVGRPENIMGFMVRLSTWFKTRPCQLMWDQSSVMGGCGSNRYAIAAGLSKKACDEIRRLRQDNEIPQRTT